MTTWDFKKEMVLYSWCSCIISVYSFMKLYRVKARHRPGVPESLFLLWSCMNSSACQTSKWAHLIHERPENIQQEKVWVVFYYFDEPAKLTSAQVFSAAVRSSWSSYHHVVYALAPEFWQCSSSMRLLQAPPPKASSAETKLCKYQQLQSFQYMDLCIHSSCWLGSRRTQVCIFNISANTQHQL